MTDAARCPVSALGRDLDHTDPGYNPQAHAIWASLREGGCPMARTPAFGGMWIPVTDDLVRKIAYDTDLFSNTGAVVGTVPGSVPPPVGSAPPITSDPPVHGPLKRMLLPAFAPQRVEAMEPEVRALCRSLAAPLAARGPGAELDAAAEYAQEIPVHVIGRMLGVPPEDADTLRRFVHALLEGVSRPEAEQMAARAEADAYVDALIAARRAQPGDTVIDSLLAAEFNGKPLSDPHLRGIILLLLLAGIDTTWSAIGASLLHLATHPDDLARVQAEPALWPTATEELLRAYAPVSMGRTVMRDTEWEGHRLRAGERVLLAFPAANRDPARFPDAERVLLDRAVNPHIAFGLGIHRCIGAHLARLELRVALEEFVRAIPRFTLPDPDRVRWSLGQVRGPRRLPLRISP
jgi:cytochrome P450